ncbi:unnamed protein product [Owenia fusiformis]|uniref:Uncharacterized protein n=1 Tax=Owenia fusiformis TaxID=6347 RepID=A0A8J1THV7_OWEFU|nr:unnamed protein product [Owenia fusiformis]
MRALIFFGLLGSVFSQSIPTGCAFTDGRCSYFIELGHKGQCDKRGTGNGDSEQALGKCRKCDSIEKDLADTKVVVMERLIEMKDQVIDASRHRNTTDGRLDQIDSALSSTAGSIGGLDNAIKEANSRIARTEERVNTVVDVNRVLTSRIQTVEQRLRISQQEIEEKQEEIRRITREKENLEREGGERENGWNSEKKSFEDTIKALTENLEKTSDQLTNTAQDLQQCYQTINITKPVDEIIDGDNGPTKTYTFNFDDDADGNMTKYGGGQANFVRRKGKSTTANSGPDADHTMGNKKGTYMFIDTEAEALKYRSSRLRAAMLQTPTIPTSKTGYCIQFWYHMYGSEQQTFNVYAKVKNGLGYPIYSKKGDQGDTWRLGEVTITSEYSRRPFEIVFEGQAISYQYISGNYRYSRQTNSQIAIDDIYITNRPCQGIKRCPAGSIPATDGSSSCFVFVPTAMTWPESVLHCKKYGAKSHLVEVNSKERHDFLVNVTKNNKALEFASREGWWTSGNDDDKWGVWKWLNTPTLNRFSYTNWHPGQPNNVANEQHCMLMEYPANNWAWGDVECFSKHPFICEISV